MPTPQAGDTNIKGVKLPDYNRFAVEALESLYGQQPVYSFNPLCFFCSDGSADALPPGAEILFDLIAASNQPTDGGAVSAFAVNVRAR